MLAGTLTIRGKSRPERVPVIATLSGTRLRVTGSTNVKQTDFGITPVNKIGGAIQVKDAVTVEFDLVLDRKP